MAPEDVWLATSWSLPGFAPHVHVLVTKLSASRVAQKSKHDDDAHPGPDPKILAPGAHETSFLVLAVSGVCEGRASRAFFCGPHIVEKSVGLRHPAILQ